MPGAGELRFAWPIANRPQDAIPDAIPPYVSFRQDRSGEVRNCAFGVAAVTAPNSRPGPLQLDLAG